MSKKMINLKILAACFIPPGGKKRGDDDGSEGRSSSSTPRRRGEDEDDRGDHESVPKNRGDEEAGSSNSWNNEDFWSIDLDRHSLGHYSFAVIKANKVMEGYSQVVVGRQTIFFGLYDGHHGHQAAQYVCDHLFDNLMGHVRRNATMSDEVLKRAFLTTDAGWMTQVAANFQSRPEIAAVGASCLVGVIWRGKLYVANAGGCRAIMLQALTAGSHITIPRVLAWDDNINNDWIRLPVLVKHEPDREKILVKVDGTYLVKGTSQLSKSIGDAYLKKPAYNIDELPGFRLREPLHPLDMSAVSAEPSTKITTIQAGNEFVILASHGLWDNMSNYEAIKIVETYPRKGIAARLIREGLEKAAEKHGMSYADLLKVSVENGGRKTLHDDITVVVIFFNEDLQETVIEEEMSVKVGATNFSDLEIIPFPGSEEESNVNAFLELPFYGTDLDDLP